MYAGVGARDADDVRGTTGDGWIDADGGPDIGADDVGAVEPGPSSGAEVIDPDAIEDDPGPGPTGAETPEPEFTGPDVTRPELTGARRSFATAGLDVRV